MVYTSITSSYVAANTRVAFQRKLGSQPSIFQGSTYGSNRKTNAKVMGVWSQPPNNNDTRIPWFDALIYIIIVAIFSTESRVLAPQKPSILESHPAPLLCYKIKNLGWQARKSHPFWTCLDCILVGPWFCKWGPQPSAGSAQNPTFWSWNWFCRDKACDTLRSLIF